MNQAKTILIILAMTALLVWMGGALYGKGGVYLAILIGLVLNGTSYFFSDRIVLMTTGARLIERAEAPELFDIVANLSQRAGLPMPRIAMMPDEAPNAFATGRDPEHAVVAVTEGIVRLMSRPELEAVLAHELGHVKHRDILISSLSAVLAQAIMFLSRMALWFGGGRDREDRGNPIAAIAAMILGPIAAMLLQMAVSRSREYMADEYSAHLTGRPDQLASALEHLQAYNQRIPMPSADPSTVHMMIINPFSARGIRNLFSTHPPIEDRVAKLRGMPVEAR